MRGITVIFALIINYSLLTINCFPQLVQQEWVARYPGPGNDIAGPFLAVDKLGNSFVVGTHRATPSDTTFILIVKYNTSGVQQWATLYKYLDCKCQLPYGLALDTSGNPCVTAEYRLQGCVAIPNVLTVKFDSFNGSVIWAARHIASIRSTPHDIKIDRLNNIYVVGNSDSSAFCLKYSAVTGDSIWIRKWQPNIGMSWANACTIDDSLNVIMTGVLRHWVTTPPPGYMYDSVVILKYSPNGILRWVKTYRYDIIGNAGRKIVPDQYGNVYVGGQTLISGLLVWLTLSYDRNGVWQWAAIYNPPGGGDNRLYGIAMDRVRNSLIATGYVILNSIGSAATIKYDIWTGDSVWVRTGFGVSGSSSSWDAKVDSSGDVYITGGSQGASSSDVSTLKYSWLGNQVWFITYNGPFNGGDGGYALELHNLDIYVLGLSQSGPSVSDYLTIKYSQLVLIQPISNTIPGEFKLEQNYPNPFNQSTIINYRLPIASTVSMKVYDMLGQEVAQLVDEKQKAGIYAVRFNGSTISSGVYIYRLLANGNTIGTKKFVVVK